MKDMKDVNLRDFEISTSTPKSVHETMMLSGEAKDSLSGKNVIQQYMCEAPPLKDIGGMNTNK